ncbi:MAG: hypothetical protein CFH19_00748 [Alphaproteobacteria bacterium MarineAlpha5_Bin9]|nr:MAG: hypothetical protein CFH19_00748 [Alphaproteobacteria bacterium MarineAlpha5_Bin9]|tara:strand:+ start:1201 stop:1941 length:741 start_codon:yes stop_codon:yes gene_type:complete
MTLSIVARDHKTGDFGVCGFTDIAGYGSLVPHVSLKGAVATQAYVNVDNGLKIMELIDSNININKAGNIVINNDKNKHMRQMAAIDKNNYFEWTGENTLNWKGYIKDNNFIVSGNCMESIKVLESSANYYNKNLNEDFPLRLIKSIQAGENAGGHIKNVEYYDSNLNKKISKKTTDIFGKYMSAGLTIASIKPEIWHNLRVDADENALNELEKTYYKTVESANNLNKFYNGAIEVRPFFWRKVSKN